MYRLDKKHKSAFRHMGTDLCYLMVFWWCSRRCAITKRQIHHKCQKKSCQVPHTAVLFLCAPESLFLSFITLDWLKRGLSRVLSFPISRSFSGGGSGKLSGFQWALSSCLNMSDKSFHWRWPHLWRNWILSVTSSTLGRLWVLYLLLLLISPLWSFSSTEGICFIHVSG